MGVGGGTLLSGWRGALFKEWTFTTQITAGQRSAGVARFTSPTCRAPESLGRIRPEYTGAPLYAAPAGLFLNPAAYVAPLRGQWGNAGRDSITGPAQFTLNASLGRTFRLNDRFNVDLRVDATNALNHVTFASWNTTVNSAQFGLPTAGQCHAQRAGHAASEVLTMRPATAIFSSFSSGALRRCAQQPLPRATACRRPPSDRRQVHQQHPAGGRDRHRERQERQARRRSDRQGFHRHRRRRAADHQVLRVSEAARTLPEPNCAALAADAAGCKPRKSAKVDSVTHNQIAPETPGDIRYRDRRLLALYFDMTAMPVPRPVARPRRRRRSSSARR